MHCPRNFRDVGCVRLDSIDLTVGYVYVYCSNYTRHTNMDLKTAVTFYVPKRVGYPFGPDYYREVYEQKKKKNKISTSGDVETGNKR